MQQQMEATANRRLQHQHAGLVAASQLQLLRGAAQAQRQQQRGLRRVLLLRQQRPTSAAARGRHAHPVCEGAGWLAVDQLQWSTLAAGHV